MQMKIFALLAKVVLIIVPFLEWCGSVFLTCGSGTSERESEREKC